MGYYTNFSLDIEPSAPGLIIQINEEEGDDAYFGLALEDDGSTNGPVKWYEWEEDMRRISSKYPEYLFHLSGIGEDNEDIWEATFKNGKVHIRHAEITIPSFDETKLE